MGTGIQAKTLYGYLQAVSLLALFDCYTPMRIKTNTSRNETCALTTATSKIESNPAVHALLYAPEASHNGQATTVVGSAKELRCLY